MEHCVLIKEEDEGLQIYLDCMYLPGKWFNPKDRYLALLEAKQLAGENAPCDIIMVYSNGYREKIDVLYNANENLTIIAREKHSYKLMKENFNSNIILNPDIVFYLNNKIDCNKFERTNIMTCLRNDKESVLGSNKEKLITDLELYKKSLIYQCVTGKKEV